MATLSLGFLFRSVVFNILAVVFLLGAGYLLLFDPNSSGAVRGGIAFIIGAFCAFLANIDSFESFKASASGFEAKLREAQAVIDNAKATVESLHQLASMAGAFFVEGIAAEGRVGGPITNRLKDMNKQKLIQNLQAMGLSDDNITKVSFADKFWVSLDYVYGIFPVLTNRLPDNGWPTLSPKDISELRQVVLADDEPAAPDRCELALNNLKVSEPFAFELLKDYSHYCSTGKQRRPDVWSKRATWATSRA